ncbi:MAG: hypothetical protein B5M56_07480 [Desulfococcus sp. 4484_241]|nr:MAG: hypothetical protein B5M56_07480 [Desulfococcus sp. 4484_241]
MSIHIIIDGYNLIRSSPAFSRAEQQSLQDGREALIAELAAYKKIKAHSITVVFDGTGAPVHYPQRDLYRGIDVRFSGPGQTADSVICKMASKEREKALVVSSDRAIMRFAQSVGAAVIDSLEFEERMAMAMMEDAAGSQDAPETESSPWNGTTRKKGPSKRLPKKKRKSRTRTRKL